MSKKVTGQMAESIRQAKVTGAIIITTHAAFIGFDDLYDFLKEASDEGITVTFAPMSPINKPQPPRGAV